MRRTDLLILWHLPNGADQRCVIECKIQRGSRESTIESGVEQVIRYADTCGADEVCLVIFNPALSSWDEKIYSETRIKGERSVSIFGM